MPMPLTVGIARGLLNSGINIVYLLRDLFTTAQAAPLTTPRTCEPGPGQFTINDPSNTASISNSQLVLSGATSAVISSISTFTRAAGEILLWKRISTDLSTTEQGGWGWDNVNTFGTRVIHGFVQSGSGLLVCFPAQTGGIDTVSLGITMVSGQTYDLAVMLRGTGAFYFVKGSGVGDSVNWCLVWVANHSTTASLYAKGAVRLGACKIASFRVTQLSSPFNSDYGIATNRIATTSNGDTSTSNADAIIEHTITAASGVTQDLMVRRASDTDCWDIRMDQGGSTVSLIEIVAGVETSRGSAAQTWTNGTQYRVVDIQESSTIKVFVANTSKISYASATTQQTTTGVKVSRAGVDLVAWPRVINSSLLAGV